MNNLPKLAILDYTDTNCAANNIHIHTKTILDHHVPIQTIKVQSNMLQSMVDHNKHIYTHTHIHTYIRTHIHTCTHIHTYTHSHICVCMFVCVYVCMYVCIIKHMFNILYLLFIYCTHTH